VRARARVRVCVCLGGCRLNSWIYIFYTVNFFKLKFEDV